MAQSKHLLDQVITIAEGELRRLQFRKTKGVYICQLDKDAYGWVGLNTVAHRSDGRVGINPVLGVRYEPMERMVCELLGEKESILAPSISTSAGYLMPEGQYMEWLFEPAPFDYRSECERMVECVELYGLPFMKSNSKLEIILHDLEQLRFASKDTAAYRLPVAFLLSGQNEPALTHVSRQLEELKTRSDLAAQEYKKFAGNILAKLGDG
jgi:hypothetical protein